MTSQAETGSVPWIIELHAPHLLHPIKVFIKDRLTVGRSAPGKQAPDVDLGASDAEEHPVSCQHCALYCEGQALMVMDLNSETGTSLNDEHLTARNGYPLKHGDQLRLGRLRLDVNVILSPTSGGAMHYQPGLNLHDQTPPSVDQWILIVEDDPDIGHVLGQMMRDAGYTTRTARDVVGAIRIFSQMQPNAVILDLNMPDMNGMEFCRYVRRDVLHNTVPILALGAGNPDDSNAALQAGADMVMERPMNAADLCEVVVALVNQHENSTHAIRTRRLPTTPFDVFPPDTRRQGAILFVNGYEQEPIIISGQKSVSFGRKPGTGSIGSQNHIDLTRYDAANCGVSRIHCFLHHHDGGIFIEDVGSRNHTYVNGDMVCPFVHAPVQNGDEIRLGHLRMYVYLFEDETQ